MDNKNLQWLYLVVLSIPVLMLMIPAKSSINERKIVTGFAIGEQNNTASEFVYFPPAEITKEGALDALIKAEEEIKDVAKLNLTTYFLNDILLKAKRSYIGEDKSKIEDDIKKSLGIKKTYLESLLIVAESTPIYEIERLDYNEVFKLTQLIAFKKQQISNIIDTTPLLEKKIRDYGDKKIDTSEGIKLVEEAKSSLKGERYDEAEVYLKEADLKLEKASSEYQRVKGIALLGKNFFLRYWWQIILIIIISSIILVQAIKRHSKKSAVEKIESLKLELKALDELMKRAQEELYHDKKITKDVYDIRVDRYNRRKAEIRHTLPILEMKAYGEKKEDEKKFEGVIEIKR